MPTNLQNVIERISAEYYQLTASERKVADYADLVIFTMPLECKSAFQRGSLEQPQLPPALFSCIQAHSHQLVAQKAT